jgi:hypothetical protein
MQRMGFYSGQEDTELGGLMPVRPDGSTVEGLAAKRVRMFRCMFCGFVALFSEDHEDDLRIEDGITVQDAFRLIMKQPRAEDA